MEQRLPIKRILLDSIIIPFAHYKQLLRLCWPFIIMFLIGDLYLEQLEKNLLLSIGYLLLITVTGVLSIIACHQVFLLSPEQVKKTSNIHWGFRETNFVLYLIGAGLILLIFLFSFAAAFNFIGQSQLFEEFIADYSFLALVLLSLPLYLISRWSLVLPSLAIDKTYSLSWAWRLSSGHSGRLFLLLGLLPILLEELFTQISVYVPEYLFFSLLETIVWLIVYVVEVCILSLSYQWLISNQADTA